MLITAAGIVGSAVAEANGVLPDLTSRIEPQDKVNGWWLAVGGQLGSLSAVRDLHQGGICLWH